MHFNVVLMNLLSVCRVFLHVAALKRKLLGDSFLHDFTLCHVSECASKQVCKRASVRVCECASVHDRGHVWLMLVSV